MHEIDLMTETGVTEQPACPAGLGPAEPGGRAGSEAEPLAAGGAAPRILIADDNASMRQALRDWLGANFPGAQVLEARTAEEAVWLAVQRRPDVVLLDLRLPRMNGLAAARLIGEQLPGTHIVMVSNHDDDAFRVAARRAGAAHFVPKRSIHLELAAVVRELLAAARTA